MAKNITRFRRRYERRLKHDSMYPNTAQRWRDHLRAYGTHLDRRSRLNCLDFIRMYEAREAVPAKARADQRRAAAREAAARHRKVLDLLGFPSKEKRHEF